MGTEVCEYPFLEEVFRPEQEHKIDLVFVHGLNAFGRNRHPYETWTHENGIFWPTIFLAEDIPFARMFVYGYNSSVANAEQMSTARIKDHADTLLNLLDLERSSQQGQYQKKIIFISHSLGGLVVKQALLNAHEDPKYTAIRNATFGLVFFGTPHHGARGVELGKLAAKLAKFVSKGNASNELLECLEHNSLFTRQMSERFRHQLEDYRVLSFIEGKPMTLGAHSFPSISQMIVDRSSAVLGLAGSRETQLTLDADHSGMCKIGSRGAMYKLVKGNIKNLADQALEVSQGYVPPAQPSPRPSGPVPPPAALGFQSYISTPLNSSQAIESKVIGSLYVPTSADPRSTQIAELKNAGYWEQAKVIMMQMYSEHKRNSGPEHLSTLESGYELAAADAELGYLETASGWANWVSSTCQRLFGSRHTLSMKAESIRGAILVEQGQQQQALTILGNVFARQQDTIGDDNLDTLETQRRLAVACRQAGKQQDALVRLKKRSEACARLLGKNHVRFFESVLDLVEIIIPGLAADLGAARFSPQVTQASQIMSPIHPDLKSSLGPQHPLTIRALRICGTIKSLEGQNTEASDILRRALSNAEDALGPDHPETMNIVGVISLVCCKGGIGFGIYGSGSSEAAPWLQRYVDWQEKRKGLSNPETRGTLRLLGLIYMGMKDYVSAEKYNERLVTSYRGDDSPAAREADNMLQLCKMNTMFIQPRQGRNGDITSFLSALKF